jgi:hypothetical protein
MKPGNRHENEMVPSHAKQLLWEMREWMIVIFDDNIQPFCSFAEGLFIIEKEDLHD